MSKITPADVNKINAEFWEVEPKKHEERMKNPALREAAMARLRSEARRRVGVPSQLSLEGALMEEEQMALKNADYIEGRVVSVRARRAGSVEKVDALQSFIISAVKKKPSITVSQLLDKICAEAGSGGRILEIEKGFILFVGANDRIRKSSISGLKDRLWRARKKLKSKD